MVYEFMPMLYIIIGCLAVSSLPEALGKLSGILLITAALIIIRLRLKFRLEKAQYIEEILDKMLENQRNLRKTDILNRRPNPESIQES